MNEDAEKDEKGGISQQMRSLPLSFVAAELETQWKSKGDKFCPALAVLVQDKSYEPTRFVVRC